MCVTLPRPKLRPNILNENTFDARDEFSDVFDLLLEARKLPTIGDDQQRNTKEQKLAASLQSMITEDEDKLMSLTRHKRYSRHVIGTDGDWMGFVCRWENQINSAVHGHPSFAYYQVVKGKFQMDLYDALGDQQAQQTLTENMKGGDRIWRQGEKGCYDNMIHRVCSQEAHSFTIHLFSDDPAKGLHYNAV